MSTWTKIYSYNNTGDNSITTIGVDQNDQFIVECESKLKTLDERKNYVALLTLLETDKKQFETELKDKVTKDKINELKKELFKFGLTVSPYWSELAINWIEIEDVDKELKELLSSATLDKRLNQGLRNKVRQLIKEIE